MMRIVVDKRERESGIPKLLQNLGVMVDFRVLSVGDYVVSPECAVERKNAKDFINSIFSGRVFDQAYRLSQTFRFPIIVVEGRIEEVAKQIKPSIYWGALASLVFTYGCATLFTDSKQQTAELIHTIAKRRGYGPPRGPMIKRPRAARTLRERQLAILCAIPGIGPKTADRMLRNFGSVKRVMASSEAELAVIAGIGRKKASDVVSLLRSKYHPEAKEKQLKLKIEKNKL